MNWITIDRERCNGCGICAVRCVRCFSDEEGTITAHAYEETCSLCGHCVSLCPRDAIHHGNMNMENFQSINGPAAVDSDQFIRLLSQRRSHRHYRDRDIPRHDLEKLVATCRYIPTGSNRQTVHVTVFTQRDAIQKLSDLSVDYFMDMIGGIEDQVQEYTSRGEEPPRSLTDTYAVVKRYKIMGLKRDNGIDPIFHKAPVVIVFHSPPSPSTPHDDCVIAAQTVVLASMTMGLGTCYIGLLSHAFNGSPAVREALNLPSGHTPHSVLTLGYPLLKYLKTVDRQPLNVDWVS